MLDSSGGYLLADMRVWKAAWYMLPTCCAIQTHLLRQWRPLRSCSTLLTQRSSAMPLYRLLMSHGRVRQIHQGLQVLPARRAQ